MPVPNKNRSCQPFNISDNGFQLRKALLQNFQTFLFLNSKLYFSLLALVQFAPKRQQSLLTRISRYRLNLLRLGPSPYRTFPGQ